MNKHCLLSSTFIFILFMSLGVSSAKKTQNKIFTTRQLFQQLKGKHKIFQAILYKTSVENQKQQKEQQKNHKPNQKKQQSQQQKGKGSFSVLQPLIGVSLQQVFQSTGIIRSSWYKKDKLITFVYGTAFLASSNILVTCTHNIYSNYRKTFANCVQFLPNIEKGIIRKYKLHIRQSIKFKSKWNDTSLQNSFFVNFFTNEKILEAEDRLNFQLQPKMEEISLIAIEPYPMPCAIQQQKLIMQENGNEEKENSIKKLGIPLGNLKLEDMRSTSELRVIGYPSEFYGSTMYFQSADVERKELIGRYHSIEYYTTTKQNKQEIRLEIINYTMPTSLGFSGSPIIASNGDKYYAIGIHTHRGKAPGYNSGVYFNRHFLKAVDKFRIEINQRLKRYAQERDEAFNEEIITFLEYYEPNQPPSQQNKKQNQIVIPKEIDQKSIIPESQNQDQDEAVQQIMKEEEDQGSNMSNSPIESSDSFQSQVQSQIEDIYQIVKLEYLSQMDDSDAYSQMSEMEDFGLLQFLTFEKDTIEEAPDFSQSTKRNLLIKLYLRFTHRQFLIVQRLTLFFQIHILRNFQAELMELASLKYQQRKKGGIKKRYLDQTCMRFLKYVSLLSKIDDSFILDI